MTAHFLLTATDGRTAVLPVPAGQDRWVMAVRYVRAYFLGDVYVADLRPATAQKIAAFQAEHLHERFG